MKRVLTIGLVVFILLIVVGKTQAAYKRGKITSSNKKRDCDPAGCGHFGASRSSGTREHRGVDYVAKVGERITSPIDGTIKRYSVPYAGDSRYSGVEIIGSGQDSGYLVKIFYLDPNVDVGQKVKAGDQVGKAQNIVARYPGSNMINHVHLELYLYGDLVDPANHFK